MRQGFCERVVAVVALVGLVAGCSSDTRDVEPPPVQPQKASLQAGGASTVESFRNQLATGRAQIDATLGSLAKLTDPATTDIRGAYDTYSDNLARTTQHAETLKREATAMRESRNEYFSAWEAKMTEIDNPTIRATAEARRQKLRQSHEKIVTASLEARDAYEPLMRDLQDVRKFMAGDLTKANAALLVDVQKKANASGAVVKQKIDAIIAELDQVAAAK